VAWTTPRTWATGEVVTAALLNTHLRDNLKALAGDYLPIRAVSPSTLLTPVASTAYLVPFRVQGSKEVTSINWECETSSGNMNLAIYNAALARQWRRSATSFAMPAAGAIATLISAGTPTTLTLEAGDYFLAFGFDNTTARVGAYAGAGLTYLAAGVLKSKASDLAMSDPSTATDVTAGAALPFGLIA